ncbi:C-terminal helicase domain-containing protein [Mucilaginibacter sp.]|uniref:C-terminal helicase domain-containing protein n=1 Tax=Mucilaginibacter sp. TaxID=1882438 RepID=UPI00260A9A71|nr:C-terminal helicase domain-containing protein [Mucilaginibacter sp.]
MYSFYTRPLVFSQFVGMLELIQKELVNRNIGFSRLTGQTRNRPQVINEFQSDINKRMFLISLKVGGHPNGCRPVKRLFQSESARFTQRSRKLTVSCALIQNKSWQQEP